MSLIADLEALRDLLQLSLLEAPVDKRAPIAKEYRTVLVQIDVLAKASSVAKGTPLDELKTRRASRGAGAAVARRAKGKSADGR